jgi:hypothetical protein
MGKRRCLHGKPQFLGRRAATLFSDLLKKPQGTMRKFRSTIGASVKCSRRAVILMIES